MPQVVLYHKPEGEIVSRKDPEGRASVFERVPVVRHGRWLAVGRLDYNTCGLLVFTDSGELANQLTHPRFQMRRDYAVRVLGELTQEQMQTLRSGVTLDDGPARFDLLEPNGGEGSNHWYRVRVREGRNRLVRRMFGAMNFTVSRLMRTAFGPFELPPRVKRGQWLRLESEEVKRALDALSGTQAGQRQRSGKLQQHGGHGEKRPERERRGPGGRPEGAARSPARPRERFNPGAAHAAGERGPKPSGGAARPGARSTERGSAQKPRRPPRRFRAT
jgi:pseudouridine synthase